MNHDRQRELSKLKKRRRELQRRLEAFDQAIAAIMGRTIPKRKRSRT